MWTELSNFKEVQKQIVTTAYELSWFIDILL